MTPEDVASLLADPEWFAHRYDPEHDAFHFLRIGRATHRAAVFLTDEYLPANLDKQVIGRAQAAALIPPFPAPHFLFHSAFCCSTMLARALDIPGLAMALKEPPIYNDITGWRHRGAPAPDVARVLDQGSALLARPFAPGEAVIVKPSNVANAMARVLLAMRAESKAVFLHAPLPTYLRSIAKKGIDGRLWVRDLLSKQLRDGLIDMGFEQADYLRQTDLQVAAVGWMAQQALFFRLAEQFGEGRVRTLDSETLLARPGKSLAAMLAFYGIEADRSMVDGIVAGPAFNTHSKSGTQFDHLDRDAEYTLATEHHGDEIAKVIEWANAVAASANIAMTLPSPLLS